MLLNDTQIAIRDQVRAFSQARLQPLSRNFEAEQTFPPELFVEMGSLGLFGMTASEEYGGAAMDRVSYALALMEIAKGDGALSTIVSIQNSLMVSGLIRYGSEDQKQRFLPELMSGRIAGLGLVFAVTDPDKGKRGISCFLVPTDKPGYLVDKVEHKLGQAASDTCAIRLDDVFVESSLRVGEEGAGYSIALSNLEAGRVGIAAQSIGMADAALEIAVSYARDRRSFGAPIIEHQAVGFRLADLAARLEAARQLVLHAASLMDAGQPALTAASMAKLVASETAEHVVSGALQTLGGYGYLEEFGIAKIYRDVRVCQIYEGTSDIQKMVIARALQAH